MNTGVPWSWDGFAIQMRILTILFSLQGLIFQTEVEPEEKFFQGGLEKFWKQVSLVDVHVHVLYLVNFIWHALIK